MSGFDWATEATNLKPAPNAASVAAPASAAPTISGAFDWAAQAQAMGKPGWKPPAQVAPQAQYNPATGNKGLLDLGVTTVPVPGWIERGLEGTGKAFADIGRGVGERVGLVSPQQVAASRAIDAPLMATTAGKVGNVTGNVAAALPLMFTPGVNTVAGGALVGATLGAIQPTAPGESVVKNTLTGAAMGGLGTGIGNKVADVAGGLLTSRAANAARQASINAERDAVLAQGRAVGLKVPPTAVNPNLVNTAAESIAGKAATRQALEASNAKIYDRLTAQDFGLPTDKPVTVNALKGVRQKAGETYENLKGTLTASGPIPSDEAYNASLQNILAKGVNLEKAYPGIGATANQKIQEMVKAAAVPNHDPSAVIDLTKYLRNEASGNFKAAFRSGDPEKLAIAHAQQSISDAAEDLIGRHLESIGQGELAQQWQNARTTIAKSYQAQAALKNGHVNMINLARQLSADKPLSGGMALGAKFATHFPEVSRIPQSGAGVSKLGFWAAALGEGGAAYLHSPELAAAGLSAVAAPYALRKGITTGIGQSLLASPRYPSLSAAALNQLLRGATLARPAGLLTAPVFVPK